MMEGLNQNKTNKMRLKFNDKLQYQLDALSSIAQLFKGQEVDKSVRAGFEIKERAALLGVDGYVQTLTLSPSELMANLFAVQDRNEIPKSLADKKGKVIDKERLIYDIEMETGTGKTYIYLRSIYELFKHYGFMKFIITVPSIAILEGTLHSLALLAPHFNMLYSTIAVFKRFKGENIADIRDFATSTSGISILVMTSQSINKSTNKANKMHEDINMRPIDLLASVRPIMIVDEPQSQGGENTKDALENLHPLFRFHYSATHKEAHHKVYSLDPRRASELGLVKQCEAVCFSAEADVNAPLLELVSTNIKDHSAKLRVLVKVGDGVKEAVKTVRTGDRLEELTARAIYEPYTVDEIWCEEGNEFVAFSGEVMPLYRGKRQGNELDNAEIKRALIRATIKEHLEKQLAFYEKGVKVLSLFFIDAVERYRVYGASEASLASGTGGASEVDLNGVAKGEYAKVFEEELLSLLEDSERYDAFVAALMLGSYEKVSEVAALRKAKDFKARLIERIQSAHDGYFAMDKKGVPLKLKEDSTVTSAIEKDVESAYNLIMKDKERLLSFDTNLAFIFSHSALREGWDNPNVFNICSLRESSDVGGVKYRQEIGRGLRLAVKQDGARLSDSNEGGAQRLSIIAEQSYATLAKCLQEEYSEDGYGTLSNDVLAKMEVRVADIGAIKEQSPELGGILEARVAYEKAIWAQSDFDSTTLDGKPAPIEKIALGKDAAAFIEREFKNKKLLDEKNEPTKALVNELASYKNDTSYTMELPCALGVSESFARCLEYVVDSKNERIIKDARKKKPAIVIKRDVLNSASFAKLMDDIAPKTAWRVSFDEEKLTNVIARALASISIGERELTRTTALIHADEKLLSGKVVSKEGVLSGQLASSYNIVGSLVAATSLGRKMIVDVLNSEVFSKSEHAGYKAMMQAPEYFVARASAEIKGILQGEVMEAALRGNAGSGGGASGASGASSENDGVEFVKIHSRVESKSQSTASTEGLLSKSCCDMELEYEKTNALFDVKGMVESMEGMHPARLVETRESKKSAFNLSAIDSDIEERFIRSCEEQSSVLAYLKLPSEYTISLPLRLGSYNPDFALLKNGAKNTNIIETKGSKDADMLRAREHMKTDCGKLSFKSIGLMYEVSDEL